MTQAALTLEPVDHSCLACREVHTDAREVVLHDGRVVSSYSEAWRAECEATAILSIPDRNMRNVSLGMIRDRRGKDVADRLEKLVRVIWNLRLEQRRAAG